MRAYRNCWASKRRRIPDSNPTTYRTRPQLKTTMRKEIGISLYVLVVAVPLGLELVRRVSPLLHTPLMSLTNAISAISVVGAILISGAGNSPQVSKVLGCVAVVSSTINIVSGFLITDRMLKMFKKKESPKAGSN